MARVSHEQGRAAIAESGRHRTRPMRFVVLALILLTPGLARAQGGIPTGSFGSGEAKARPDHVEEDLVGTPSETRSVPRGTALPDLTHQAPELSFEHTIASVTPRVPLAATDRTRQRYSAHLFHLDYEMPLLRHVYAGAEWGFAAARSPAETGSAFIAGQPQLFARAVRSFARDRYSVGAGLGLLPPVFTYDDKPDSARLAESTASTLVATVRPWDLSTFLDRRFTARPWIDMRVTWRRFVLQLRQGLDVNYRTSAVGCTAGIECEKSGDMQLMSTTTLFVGWRPTRDLALGLEAWEVYLLKTHVPIADRDRSVFALSPSVRFYYRWVEPAVSMLFPIGSPLLNASDGYFALRIDVRVRFGSQ